ncbi:flagellin [Vibrio parahaemolyticus]|nr:flagellin [Vibrio parahaemolyticus]MDF4879350.1 flagellin [Vibrio parahaemolyticus]MDF5390316.1 flagellin [Vibrio parahaemolyticus]MDF5396929.1 flagellin [Vibrio parahaemolyticus]
MTSISSINTNAPAMQYQSQLNRSIDKQNTSMERLSSGSKINSAKDDAAGLQISNRLQSQSRGMDVAIRNAHDGISLLQTAEGAMQEYTENLMQMRDLALRYGNSSLNSEDREAINQEYTALVDELSRITQTTSYGGDKLLNGSSPERAFQIGSSSGESISISLPRLGECSQDITTNERRIIGYREYNKDWSAKDGDTFRIGRYSYIPGGPHETIQSTYIDIIPGSSMDEAVKQINKQFSDIVELSTEEYTNEDGTTSNRLVYLALNSDEFIATNHYHRNRVNNSYNHSYNNPFTTMRQDHRSPIVELTDKIWVNIIPKLGSPETVGYVLDDIDTILKTIDSERAKLGATQNRLSYAIKNLTQSNENLAASNSQIRDTDFAKESTQLTKQSILREVNTSMLAQASNAPRSALNLLS